MTGLKYKTRGKSSPYNKSKVFFVCHPADFDDYFNKITDLILKKQNCVIWYLENGVDYSGEVLEELCQMQLIVMPITVAFLESQNSIKDGVLPYVIEKRIPLLPIAVDHGIEEAFNSICGDFQCIHNLDFTHHDSQYNQKLSDYLATALVGDALAEKIRETFDRYIFLSYRKKDHKQAKRLMKMIHSIPEFQSTAIWYDEYLVPGEKFSKSIQELINKSNIFMMLITPHILEHENYIIEVEYPIARELGKRIVPIEMESTNRLSLFQSFNDIPSPLTIDDIMKDSSMLMDATFQKRNREKDKYHLYYMGMAYLKGIDVEIDIERAVKLFEESAILGCVESASKLASMYENNEHISSNIKQSKYWHNYVVNLVRNTHMEKDYFKELIYSVSRLGYRSIGESYRGYYALLTYLCDRYGSADKKSAAFYSIIGNNAIGSYYAYELKHVKKGLGYYQKAIQACEIANRENIIDTRKLLSSIYHNLGIIWEEYLHEYDKNYETARQYYGKAVHIRKKLAEENYIPETISDLLLVYKDYSILFNSSGDISTALRYDERCIPLLQDLIDLSVLHYDTEKYHKELINLYISMAKKHDALGNNDEKKRYLYMAESMQFIQGLFKE